MKLPKYLTKVTPFSKTIACILFVTLPILGFFLGMHYQSLLDGDIDTVSLHRPFPVVVHATFSQYNHTIYAHKGDTVSVDLPNTFSWKLSTSDIQVLQQQGSSQNFLVVGNGTASITGTGAPTCKGGQFCSRLLIAYSVTVNSK